MILSLGALSEESGGTGGCLYPPLIGMSQSLFTNRIMLLASVQLNGNVKLLGNLSTPLAPIFAIGSNNLSTTIMCAWLATMTSPISTSRVFVDQRMFGDW